MAFSKASLTNLGRVVGAALVGGAVSLILSPSVTNLVPSGWGFVVTGLAIPALIALDKKLFGATPNIPAPAPVAPTQKPDAS